MSLLCAVEVPPRSDMDLRNAIQRAAAKHLAWTPPPGHLPNGMKVSEGGDSVGGQYNGYVAAFDKGENIGHIDYHIHGDDEFLVAMIEVKPEYRRQGIATMLVDYVKIAQFDDPSNVKVKWGYTTDDGDALRRSYRGSKTAAKKRVVRGVTLDLDEEETGEFAKALPNAGRFILEKIRDGISRREGMGIGVWWTTDRKTALDYAEAMVIYMNGSSRFGVVITAEIDEADTDDPARGFTDQYPVVMIPGAPIQVIEIEVMMPPPAEVLAGWQQASDTLEQPRLSRSQPRSLPISPMRAIAMPGWRNKANGPFWQDYDAVIAPEWTPRGNNYDVWAKQEIIGTAHSLADAKAMVETKYGPQTWRVEKMVPYLDMDAPLGPTTEFTSPKRIYVVDFL